MYVPDETWDLALVYTYIDDEYQDIGEDDFENSVDGSLGRLFARVNYSF